MRFKLKWCLCFWNWR